MYVFMSLPETCIYHNHTRPWRVFPPSPHDTLLVSSACNPIPEADKVHIVYILSIVPIVYRVCNIYHIVHI